MNKGIDAYVAHKRRTVPDFDPSDLEAVDPLIRKYFGTSTRVKVRNTRTGHTRTGRVRITAGHRPAFLLMYRWGDVGSSDVLTPSDAVVAVKRDSARTYTSTEGSPA